MVCPEQHVFAIFRTVPKARTDDQMRVWYKTPPQDDVWLQRYYMKRVCTLAEAVSFHREAFHPSVLNVPDAAIQLDVELDMKLEKVSSDIAHLLAAPLMESCLASIDDL